MVGIITNSNNKIGILTYCRTINYGTYFQCFALAKQLEKMLPQFKIEIIDYSYPSTYYREYKGVIYYLSKFKFDLAYRKLIRILNFRKAQKLLPYSKEKIISYDSKKIFKKIKNKYMAIILGSDTVLNSCSEPMNVFLLNDEFGCFKLTYAVSAYGINSEKFEKNLPEISKALNDFSFFSVRDDVTSQMLKNILPQKEIFYSCDPTLFLNLDDYCISANALKEKLKRKHNMVFDKPLLGLMSENNEVNLIVKKLFGETHTIVSVGFLNENADYILIDLPLFDWARIFSLFEFTITNYFHGTLFSLFNGTPPICFNRKPSDSLSKGKVEDFLSRIDFEEHFIKEDEFIEGEELLNKINNIVKNFQLEKLNKALLEQRESFEIFLRKANQYANL